MNEEKPKTQYCYCTGGDDEFTGTCGSREEAVEEAVDATDHYSEFVQTGRIVPFESYLRHRTGIGEDLLRDLCDAISSDMMSDEPVFEATEEQEEELSRVIVNWIVKNITGLRYAVEDVQTHKIQTEAGESK